MAAEISVTLREIVLGFGGTAIVAGGIAAFLGRMVATHIAQKQRADFDHKLELLRAEMNSLSDERRDALTRKRDMYSNLVSGLRVFIKSGRAASELDKEKFLTTYAQSCLWASETVLERIALLLDTMVHLRGDDSSEAERQRKNAFEACVLEMRKDAGFPNSEFRYRFVTF